MEPSKFRYADVIGSLRDAYNAQAPLRERFVKEDFKIAERAAFLARIQAAGAGTLLEVGAGTGDDARYFTDHGLAVVATDLSPEMIQRCRVRGVEAHVMDVLGLDFAGRTFDAVWSLNCLLHVPSADMPAAMAAIARVLAPGGLFFLGVWGGDRFEDFTETAADGLRRFFAFRTDDALLRFASKQFDVIDFHVVKPPGGHRFQALTLRRRGVPRS